MARALDQGVAVASSLNHLGALTTDPVEAAASFRESLDRCAAMGHPLLTTEALEGLAAVAVAADDAPQAARLLAAAEGIRERLGTPREPTWAAYCARTAAAARAALDDATFAAARDAGRALDLDAALVAAGAVPTP
jgi:hypothetical protein